MSRMSLLERLFNCNGTANQIIVHSPRESRLRIQLLSQMSKYQVESYYSRKPIKHFDGSCKQLLKIPNIRIIKFTVRKEDCDWYEQNWSLIKILLLQAKEVVIKKGSTIPRQLLIEVDEGVNWREITLEFSLDRDNQQRREWFKFLERCSRLKSIHLEYIQIEPSFYELGPLNEVVMTVSMIFAQLPSMLHGTLEDGFNLIGEVPPQVGAVLQSCPNFNNLKDYLQHLLVFDWSNPTFETFMGQVSSLRNSIQESCSNKIENIELSMSAGMSFTTELVRSIMVKWPIKACTAPALI